MLKLHDIEPERVVPNGDRYVVEMIDVDDTVEFGRLLVYVNPKAANERDPQADPTVENRGVVAGVIVRAGNGHLLGLSDHPRREPFAERDWSSVPMFFKPGEVVLIDYNAKGRNLKIVGRECRIINQIDVLAMLEGVKLHRTADGGWEADT